VLPSTSPLVGLAHDRGRRVLGSLQLEPWGALGSLGKLKKLQGSKKALFSQGRAGLLTGSSNGGGGKVGGVCASPALAQQLRGLTAVGRALGLGLASAEFAAALDARDELRGFRDKFLIPKKHMLPDGAQRCGLPPIRDCLRT
jgi:hypothetical protein